MVFGLFIWIVVVILSLAFLFSYLLWSPGSKSPTAIAIEVVEISSQVSFIVIALTIFLVALFTALWLFNLFPAPQV